MESRGLTDIRLITESESEKLLAVVAETLDLDVSGIDFDTELHKTGRLDSLALVTLVAFLMDELGVKLAIDQIVPENFVTVRQMTKLVEQARC